jgi:hypothetical protein
MLIALALVEFGVFAIGRPGRYMILYAVPLGLATGYAVIKLVRFARKILDLEG